MNSRYKVVKLGQWAVLMTGCDFIMELFDTEEEVLVALGEFERGERLRSPKWDVWVIGDQYVGEPGICGVQIGEVVELDMRQFRVRKRLTQEEYDAEHRSYGRSACAGPGRT